MEKDRHFSALAEIYKGHLGSFEYMKQASHGELAPFVEYLRGEIMNVADVQNIPLWICGKERSAQNVLSDVASRKSVAMKLAELVRILEGTM